MNFNNTLIFLELAKKFIQEHLCEKVKQSTVDKIKEKGIFQEEYIDRHNKKQMLVNHLKSCTKNLQSNIFAQILCLCQSSGHGKTRTMLEIAEDQFVILICMRKAGENGFPSRSPISNAFEKSLDSPTASLFVQALIQTFMSTIQRLNEQKGDQKLSALFKNTQPWHFFNDPDQPKAAKETDEQIEFREGVIKLYEGLKKQQKVELITSDEWTDFKKIYKVEDLFMFVDEAGQLIVNTPVTPKPESKTFLTRFRVLRRAIQSLFTGKTMLLVLADTTTNITEFEPSPHELTSSMKKLPHLVLYQPYIDLLFVNQCVPQDYLNSLKEMTHEKLLERNPKENVFLYGRPMWSMAVKEDKYIAFAIAKLACSLNPEFGQGNDSAIFMAYALLSVRTTLTLHLDVAYSSTLIAKHLATLVNINEQRSRFQLKYIQEPLLAEASAHIMNDEAKMIGILEKLNSMLSMNLNLTGGIGEVIAQLIILRAFDKAREKKSKNQNRDFLYL